MPSTTPAFALKSRLVATPDEVLEGYVTVVDGRVAAVGARPVEGVSHIVDLGALALLPGLVDTHVHVNEPGRTEWEGFATVGRAALAGGVTTIVDMPLNSIPATTTEEAVRLKREAARTCPVRVELWGGVVPGNAGELERLAKAGVLGFKCFLVPSGVEEFAHVTTRDLREAMTIIARVGLPLLVHAELPEPIDSVAPALEGRDPRQYASWLASRPAEAEVQAIQLMIRLCQETGCRVHIVHLSAAEALPDLAAARDAWTPITVETCPHYLTFAAEEVPDGATEFKCAPPIRDAENRERLWDALLTGDIDLVASDHSPCPPDLKRRDTGDFMGAWGGVASLEIGLAAVWTGARERGVTLADVARWMSERPARIAGLGDRGRIERGCVADLVAFDPEVKWHVDPGRLKQRHPVTPYAGRELIGRVERVWIAGEEVAAPA